jgi:hypothetical protein
MAPPPVWRTGGFVLFEQLGDQEPFVHLELLTRPVNIDDPQQVDTYRRAFGNLLDAAAAGEEAGALLDHVIEDLRSR